MSNNYEAKKTKVYNILGTKLKIELDRAKDSFVLMKEASDTESYKLKLTYIALYMPIGVLSQNVFSEINSLLTKGTENKPVLIQYRNIEVRPLQIPKNTQNFYSELLFTEETPIRLVVVFVLSDSKSGNYSKVSFSSITVFNYILK